MDRRSLILDSLNLGGLGLEIGPGYGPLAAGDPALRVRTLDHKDQDALIEKYRDAPGVDVSRIQPVDYVWSGQRYIDLVGDTRFDWIVASHVIEHVPDLVGFLNQCAEILTPDGILSLAVPDKRYAFDYYRPSTGLSRLVDAHYDGRRLTSPGSVAEHIVNHATLDGAQTWSDRDRGLPVPAGDFDLARFAIGQALNGDYVDMHAWVFTPHSFRLLVHDLHGLGLVDLQEAGFSATQGCEFYCQLSRTGEADKPDRAAMARLALYEQSPNLTGSDPAAAALAAENAALQRMILVLEAENAALRQSTSWRVTAPLRGLAALTGLRRP